MAEGFDIVAARPARSYAAAVTTQPDAARRDAFEALVTEVYAPVRRYLRRRVDAATAEDVLGDVLLVLWRRFDDVPAEAPLAWSVGVARGCLANRLRGDERQRMLERRLSAQRADLSESRSSDDDDALVEAMATLPEKQQEILRLWAWEQLAPREIAVVLGISPNAASIRLHRATSQLKQLFQARKSPAPAGHQRVDRGRSTDDER
jgi:RNA polymerase sigma-70 factor (ECF subfamily)